MTSEELRDANKIWFIEHLVEIQLKNILETLEAAQAMIRSIEGEKILGELLK